MRLVRLLFSGAVLALVGCLATQTPSPAPDWIEFDNGLGSHSSVLSLAFGDGDTLYAGAYDRTGAYRSLDGGRSWSPDRKGLPASPVYTLVRLGDQLWAGTADGLFHRPLSAEDWQHIDAIPRVAVFGLAGRASGLLLAGTDGRGLYYSSDSGASWQQARGLQSEIILSAAVTDDGTLFAGTSGHGLWASRDRGATWGAPDEFAGAYVPLLLVDPASQTVYASMRKALWRTRDAGARWEQLAGGIQNEAVYALAVDPAQHRLFAGTGAHGVWTSEDDGASWHRSGALDTGNQASSPFPDGHAVLSIALRENVLAVGTVDGAFLSRDGGRSWTPSDFRETTGIGYPRVHDLAFSPAARALYLATDDGLYVSHGDSWSRVAPRVLDAPVLSLAFSLGDPNTVYAGTSRQGVSISRDGGQNWTAAGGDLGGRTSVAGLVVDPRDSKTVLARVVFERLYRSTDGGSSWSSVWSGMSDETEVETAEYDPRNPSVVYAGANLQLFRSVDGGATWQPRGLEGVTTFVVRADPRVPGRVWAGATDGLYRSDDEGEIWHRVALAGISVTALEPGPGGALYAGTKYSGAYLSRDAGNSFSALGRKLQAATVIALQVDPSDGTVYAATDAGVFLLRPGADR